MPDLPATPTLDKRSAVIEESQAIGRFLDWLSEQDIHLTKHHGAVTSESDLYEGDTLIVENGDGVAVYFPIHEGPSALLHRYFDIDPKAEEDELRGLLDAIRKNNA